MQDDLRPYRRHEKACPHKAKGQNFTKCSCPIWVDGYLNGRRFRRSTGLRDWSRVARKIDRWLTEPETFATIHTVAGAAKSYLADCKARNLAESTIDSHGRTLSHLERFCAANGISEMRGLDIEAVSRFRAWRKVTPRTQAKELQQLRAFFRFCVDREWIADNSARKVKMPKVDANPTMPFTRDEIAKMLNAIPGFAEGGGSAEQRKRSELRARALILLLMYSGLRISDASLLARDAIDPRTRKILLRTEKTKQPVYVSLHEDAFAALMALPAESDWFFWSGKSKKITHVKNMRRTVNRIISRAGIQGHPHRFRDTFAVELLVAGEDLRTVQILLGHTSIKTTEKHYAPWVTAMQRRLDDATAKLDFSATALGVDPGDDGRGDADSRVLPFTAARR